MRFTRILRNIKKKVRDYELGLDFPSSRMGPNKPISHYNPFAEKHCIGSNATVFIIGSLVGYGLSKVNTLSK